MTICFTIDKSYCQHVAVVLASLIRTNKGADIRCILVHNGISLIDKLLIMGTVRKSNVSINFISLDGLYDKNLKISSHVSVATYFRIYLPRILPKNINKVLYLDCDLLVLGSLEKLWSTNIDNYAIAAVPTGNLERVKALDLPGDYFNCGVMLMNIEYWRKFDLDRRIFSYLSANSSLIKYWDQDAVNGSLVNEILPLGEEWNYVRNEYPKSPAVIVHFVGAHKPWSVHFPLGFRKLNYYTYLRKTPYFIFNVVGFLKSRRVVKSMTKLPY